MKTRAYYNEVDPYAAEWLRNLIALDYIAGGDVDERSIEDVKPDDLRGYTQCHFFAGIGVWSLALRSAGWPDDRPVWTGSCPCQPFSAAGKRGGTADERHLWPHWFHLIQHGKPRDVPVFGEQVASKDGLAWLDLVHADLEGQGYTVGAVDLCAAGVGAPHIRQRLFFVADADTRSERLESGGGGRIRPRRTEHDAQFGLRWSGENGELADPDEGRGGRNTGAVPSAQGEAERGVRGVADGAESCSAACVVADPSHQQQHGRGGAGPGGRGEHPDGSVVGDPHHQGPQGRSVSGADRGGDGADQRAARAPGPVNGHWRDADWLPCIDGKARPVEPGAFPLAHGVAARVGRLRAYGNAIVEPVAEEFIRAYAEVRGLALTR